MCSHGASSGSCETAVSPHLTVEMPVDPFRIQFLTVTLDSQVVLTLVGLVLAGLAFGQAARRDGLHAIGAGAWWDVATAAVIGARAVWVLTHLDYYLRGPLQALVVTDGGLHPVGLVLGAAYGTWRLGSPSREREGQRVVGTEGTSSLPPGEGQKASVDSGRGALSTTPDAAGWRRLVPLVALGTLVTFLFERTGCALTTCGGGPPTEVAWALVRGTELRQPVALYQVAVLASALLLVTEVPRVWARTLAITLTALALVEIISIAAGSRGVEGLVALTLAGFIPRLAAAWAAWRPRTWAAPLPPVSPGPTG